MMSSEQRPNYLAVPILKITPDDAISTNSDAPTREWDATSEISHRDAVTLSSQSSQHADDFPESFCTSEEKLSSSHIAPMFEASGDIQVCERLLDLQTTGFSKVHKAHKQVDEAIDVWRHTLPSVDTVELPKFGALDGSEQQSESCLSDALYEMAQQSFAIEGPTVDKTFLSLSRLSMLMDANTIERDLIRDAKTSPERIRSCVKNICDRHSNVVRSFQPILAILILVDEQSSAQAFWQEGVRISSLPFTAVGQGNRSLKDLRRQDAPNKKLNCFLGWTLPKRKAFLENQWQFLPHFFEKSTYNNIKYSELGPNVVLPFVEATDIPDHTQFTEDPSERVGGFSEVFYRDVHSEHHNFGDAGLDKTDWRIAIKRLKYGTSEKAFKRECNISQKFCGRNAHPNIIPLLAAYRQYDQYHFVFPRAECNLYSFWKRSHGAPDLKYNDVCWVAEQCSGLSGGLQRLHRHETFPKAGPMQNDNQGVANTRDRGHVFPQHRSEHDLPPFAPGTGVIQSGLHADIKPHNILKHGNALILSDFGQAEIFPEGHRSRTRDEHALTNTYRAPENDLRPGKVRQASDIWSLGCVMLEMVAWMIGGFGLVKKFAQARRTYDIFFPSVDGSDIFHEYAMRKDSDRVGIRLKQEVVAFIYRLHCDPRCTEFIHALLVVIEHKMLVPDTADRILCVVHNELEVLEKRCRRDELYATRPVPWSFKHDNQPILIELRVCDIDQDRAQYLRACPWPLLAHDGPSRKSTMSKASGSEMWKMVA